jgi:hypothetical protein
MGQDLRDLFEEKRRASEGRSMPRGHEERFAERLQRNTQSKETYTIKPLWWKIAAAAVIIAGLLFGWQQSQRGPVKDSLVPDQEIVNQEHQTEDPLVNYSLGDVSPDLQKVEQFYVSQINYQLSQLPLHQDQGEVVDQYLERLAELDADYKALNQELYQQGPNDQLIAALIQNLQLRLKLIGKLQSKLNQLKSSENEQVSTVII